MEWKPGVQEYCNRLMEVFVVQPWGCGSKTLESSCSQSLVFAATSMFRSAGHQKQWEILWHVRSKGDSENQKLYISHIGS